MYAKAYVTIDDADNYTTLAQKLAQAAANLIIEKLPLYLQDQLPGQVQDETLVTFANKIKPEDEKMNINLPVRAMVNYVRALSETPGAFLLLNGQKLKIYQATPFSEVIGDKIGRIVSLSKGIIVQLVDGQISLLDVQLEGHKRLKYKDFINGQKSLMDSQLE